MGWGDGPLQRPGCREASDVGLFPRQYPFDITAIGWHCQLSVFGFSGAGGCPGENVGGGDIGLNLRIGVADNVYQEFGGLNAQIPDVDVYHRQLGFDDLGEGIVVKGHEQNRGEKCGVHKTVDSYSSLHGCGCSCFFSDI